MKKIVYLLMVVCSLFLVVAAGCGASVAHERDVPSISDETEKKNGNMDLLSVGQDARKLLVSDHTVASIVHDPYADLKNACVNMVDSALMEGQVVLLEAVSSVPVESADLAASEIHWLLDGTVNHILQVGTTSEASNYEGNNAYIWFYCTYNSANSWSVLGYQVFHK